MHNHADGLNSSPELQKNGEVLLSGAKKAEVYIFNAYFSTMFTWEDTRCLSGLGEELSCIRSKSMIGEVQLAENERLKFMMNLMGLTFIKPVDMMEV